MLLNPIIHQPQECKSYIYYNRGYFKYIILYMKFKYEEFYMVIK